MNLIPIDAGGPPPELTGGDASQSGDFASLMTGLMSGDTQIVPLLDLPTGQQAQTPEEGLESAAVDDPALVMEYVGSPPAGVLIAASVASVDVSGQQHSNPDAPVDRTIGHAVPPEIEMATGTGVTPISAPEQSATFPDRQGPLASVHPISERLTPTGVAHESEPSGPSPTGQAPSGSDVPPADSHDVIGHVDQKPLTSSSIRSRIAETAPTEPTGGHAAPISAPGPTAPQPTVASPQPTGATPQSEVGAPQTAVVAPDVGVAPVGQDTQLEPNAVDAPSVDPEIDADTFATTQPSSSRTTSAISQPAMVGIARRVEEAIAALATKPDPKVVTLQLDELDGLRLTVALRPDGIQLTSSGDTELATEIERALASRGFEMASDDGQHRHAEQRDADEGWRPQTAARSRRANPSGIRL